MGECWPPTSPGNSSSRDGNLDGVKKHLVIQLSDVGVYCHSRGADQLVSADDELPELVPADDELVEPTSLLQQKASQSSDRRQMEHRPGHGIKLRPFGPLCG
jgi:hypothetical protein